MWFKSHMALVEITTSRIGDVAAASGGADVLRTALKRAFVSRVKGGKNCPEGVLQLARDIEAVCSDRAGELTRQRTIPQRIYPILVATDKRVRTPGVWQYLNRELQGALNPERRARV